LNRIQSLFPLEESFDVLPILILSYMTLIQQE